MNTLQIIIFVKRVVCIAHRFTCKAMKKPHRDFNDTRKWIRRALENSKSASSPRTHTKIVMQKLTNVSRVYAKRLMSSATGPTKIILSSLAKNRSSSGTTSRRYSSSTNSSKILSSDSASKIASPLYGGGVYPGTLPRSGSRCFGSMCICARS